MPKSFYILLFIILIVYAYNSEVELSECLNGGSETSGRRRVSTDYSEEVCKKFNTTDNRYLVCKYDEDEPGCVEEEKNSRCVNKKVQDEERRRLSTLELSENDCKDLDTTDNTKYVCKLKEDKKRCVEELKPLSDCLSQNSRRLSTDLTEEICNKKKTSDDTKYKCVLNKDTNTCKEEKLSDCLSKRASISRRLSTDLTDSDCKNLKTSDNKLYKCVVSNDKKTCEEVNVESSNSLKLSLAILFLLLFI